MLQLKRQSDILELLKKEKNLTVKELCSRLFCSPATVRRDLAELESQGLVKRSFGGAVLNESFFDQQPLSIRGIRNVDAKQRIAASAATLLRGGETVFIDASSTTYFLAPHLREIPDLTIITNNPHLNIVLSNMRIKNYCTGGKMLDSSIALVGSEAEKFISGIRADICFFSARGFANETVTDSSKEERDIKIAMLGHSAKRCFLCDSSKLGLTYPYVVTEENEIDQVISE